MFGKRSTSAASTAPRPEPAPGAPAAHANIPPPQPAPRPVEPRPESIPAEPRRSGQAPVKVERTPVERTRNEDYYDVKTTVFNALIDTIDLTQLAKLEPDAAREEIRDIVGEIVAIKNVVMSIAEQEDMLDDICNDVLGYGPSSAASCPSATFT